MTMFAMLFLLLLGVFIGIFVFLQMLLSKMESKWPGLILPGVTLMFSLFAALGILLFSAYTATTTTTIVDGVIVENTMQMANTASVIASAVFAFVLMNIPTAILLVIYASCRSKLSKKYSLEKMSALDLE